nr:MAG TPA: hypothetical protein [Caudoviricetes sp.]
MLKLVILYQLNLNGNILKIFNLRNLMMNLLIYLLNQKLLII